MRRQDEARDVIKTRLAEARRRSGLSQKRAAELAGVSFRALGDWETGVSCPPADKLRRLLVVYDVSAQYVLGLSDHPTGLPIGKWVVDLQGLERAEAATSKDDVRDLMSPKGLLLGCAIPERPVIAVGEELVRLKERIANVEANLLGAPDNNERPGRKKSKR